MSGGYFDYFNFDMPIVSMAMVISFAKGKYKPETIKEFRRCLKYLKLADVYLHRADWLLSGDDEEDYINSRYRGWVGKTYSCMCIDPHAADYGGYTLEEQLERCKKFEKDASRCWDFSPCKKCREKELQGL